VPAGPNGPAGVIFGSHLGAAVHIVRGPSGPGLTARLLAEYFARARDIGSVLWLAPTERAAVETLRRIAASGRPMLAPNVFTVAGFARAVLTRSVPGWTSPCAASRRLVLENAVEALVRGDGLEYFRRVVETRGFLEGAAGFLEELEANAVSAQQFAAAVGGSPKLGACSELAAAVAERTGAAGSPIEQAIPIIADRLPPPFDRIRSVFVEACTSLSPLEWHLAETLAKHADLWLSLAEDLGARDDAFAPIRQTRERLSAAVEVPGSPHRERPAALAHLDCYLFASEPKPASDTTGLHLIEASGPVGEARLVARHIRTLIASGTRPGDIVVTARDLTYSRELLAEVLAEYGLPVDLDGDDSLITNPAVATLLRAVRLADDGWPFARVTAFLRSTYFRPSWLERDAETAQRAEGLLRMLGEPRDREAYLRAVGNWAETPPEPLEDEGPQEPTRLRKTRLAGECRPFLERFFKTWDGFPAAGNPAAFAAWVKVFAKETGLEAAADNQDRAVLRALWAAVEHWSSPSVTRAAFLRRLNTIASTEVVPRPAPSAGRVRIVAAEEARHLDCDYLFIVGMGERSFPRLAPPESLLDDVDRGRLRRAGLPFPDPAVRLGSEQSLFLDLIARPRRGLILSYPAIDEKGQPLLPGSFHRAVRDCFADDALKPEQQRMLIEGYLSREAMSPAEARVQFASAMSCQADSALWRHPNLSAELCEHLRWADEVAAARFRSDDYNRYDGWLDSPAALDEVRARLGPLRVFSPKALETYVACPFRFLMEHALKLQELEEPGEEVEQTRRGAAYHRALARLHRKLREQNPAMTRATLPATVNDELLRELDVAVREYADRAPSPASKVLWELEGKRLRRSAVRYRDHWDGYLDPWRKAKKELSPRLLEADFGVPPTDPQAGSEDPLVISVGGVEVRIGGRIDRVDVAELGGELGFWVIDYKTGRSAQYTSTSLSRFEKMQLTLYALALERVFFPGRKARPLGLAYWLVTDIGPKEVLPRQAMAWLSDRDAWAKFRDQLEAWVTKLVGRMREGRFPLAPRSENCTETCSFGQVCRISQSRNIGKVWDLHRVTDTLTLTEGTSR
jgi:ATP-dependent helicase/nuclease subunit B